MDRNSAPPAQHELLSIYLHDHLAGAAAGSRRARRLADAEQGRPDGPAFAELADQIDADRRALETLVHDLGVGPSRAKQWIARLGEWVGLLKLNGRLLRRSPLTTLVETEALLMAVRGKLAGWETLERTLDASDARSDVDLAALATRAREQLDALAGLHARAADRALGLVPSTDA